MLAIHQGRPWLLPAVLEHTDPLHKVTIIPMGMALGVTISLPAEDRHSYDQAYLEDSIVMAMALEPPGLDPTAGAASATSAAPVGSAALASDRHTT